MFRVLASNLQRVVDQSAMSALRMRTSALAILALVGCQVPTCPDDLNATGGNGLATIVYPTTIVEPYDASGDAGLQIGSGLTSSVHAFRHFKTKA